MFVQHSKKSTDILQNRSVAGMQRQASLSEPQASAAPARNPISALCDSSPRMVAQRQAMQQAQGHVKPTRQMKAGAPVVQRAELPSVSLLRQKGAHLSAENLNFLLELVPVMEESGQCFRDLGAFRLEQEKLPRGRKDEKTENTLYNAYRSSLFTIRQKALDWKESYGSGFFDDAKTKELAAIIDAVIEKCKGEITSNALEHSARLQEQYLMTDGQEHLGNDFEVIDEPGESPWTKLVNSVPLPLAADFKAEAALGFFASNVGGMSKIVDALNAYHATVSKIVEQGSTPIADTVIALYRLIEAIDAAKGSLSDDDAKKQTAVTSLSKKASRALAILEPESMRGRRAMSRSLARQEKRYGRPGESRMEKADREGGFFGHLFGKRFADFLEGDDSPELMSDSIDERNARINERHGIL